MRRATLRGVRLEARLRISIHALHEESDHARHGKPRLQMGISIHALHEESDCHINRVSVAANLFQSTLSMRRATRPRRDAPRPAGYFNPRSP